MSGANLERLRVGSAMTRLNNYLSLRCLRWRQQKPEVAFGTSLEADLERRDFTMNAMALTLPGLQLVDPFGGLEDLLARKLRTPVSPEVSFGDDPLRMMRAARFTSQLGAVIDDETRAAMATLAPRIDDIFGRTCPR